VEISDNLKIPHKKAPIKLYLWLQYNRATGHQPLCPMPVHVLTKLQINAPASCAHPSALVYSVEVRTSQEETRCTPLIGLARELYLVIPHVCNSPKISTIFASATLQFLKAFPLTSPNAGTVHRLVAKRKASSEICNR
jgi:hypothetical protein